MSGGGNPATREVDRLKSLIDDVINSINTIGSKAVDWVEKGLQSTPLPNLGFPEPPGGEKDKGEREALEGKLRGEIENGVHQFETLLEATIDKNFDKFEVFALRSVIAIPEDLKDWIRLRHYEGLNFSTSPDAPTIESITLQRRKYQESQRLHRLLQAEVARNASLINQLKTTLSPPPATASQTVTKPESIGNGTDGKSDQQPPYPTFGFLTQNGDLISSSSSTPLSTTTAFALSQLPSLKSLLAELRPAMKTLASPPATRNPNVAGADEEAEKSWRRERLEYVETQTRKFHENVQGLELGAQGEVRDGEWQEKGRRIDGREVEALERVVAMINGEAMDEDA